MSTSLKNLTTAVAVAALVAVSVSSAQAGDPGLRLWQKQHPGSTPPSSMLRSGRAMSPQSYRSYSYAPSAPQTVRSFSYEPGTAPAQPMAPVRSHSCGCSR
ncbi:MAG: hypothetical protein KDA90_21575 [Planctomycetaceae bacterium]|nr:hypothetical protein [Planctomycetaceae bacterium]